MIYLDNAASTRPDPAALESSARAARELWGNPAAVHTMGAAAARALEEARRQVASWMGAVTGQTVFCSGGTEANALAVLGIARAAHGRHAIVSGLEHPAVLRNAERLREVRTGEPLGERAWQLSVVAPDSGGVIAPAAVAEAVRADTALVCVMLVNNELGTVQPIPAIVAAVRAAAVGLGNRRLHVHVDAVQVGATMPLEVRTLGADSVAVSAHKLHGPRGTGALWVAAPARLQPVWDGGRQERGLRSGTENLPALVGFGAAAAIARARACEDGARVARLRDQLEDDALARVPGCRRTVPATSPRAPHIASLSFAGLPAEPLLHALERRDVIASAGSACAARDRRPSHVLRAIGSPEEDAVLRLSLSRETTAEEVQAAMTALRDAVQEIAAVAGRGPRRAAQ